MTYRIAINGFGRIGRNYLRRLTDETLANAGLQVVAINDLYDAATLAHLLEYDSTFGRLDAPVLVLPELAGRLDGVALRVPVVDGSISDLSLVLATEVTAEQINRAVAASAAAGQPMHGIIRYAEAPLVSTDIVGDFDDDTEQAIAGPVLAGILAARSAEDVLRCAFAEAQRRDVALHVLAAGPSPAADDDVLVRDLVDRWAEKYPAVPVTVSRRHDIDAVITLNGASRRCGLVVVAEPADGHDVAVVRALTRRAHCPLMVAAPVR